MALKPTSSITVPGRTINRAGEEVEMITKGRHDPCVGIRAVPIAEASGDAVAENNPSCPRRRPVYR